MFLVMAITGRTGGAVAQQLLAQGKDVRALVRDAAKAAHWAGQGVELVEGEWSDAATLRRAMEGVEGAFVMLPPVYTPSPDFRESRPLIAAYGEALRTATLRRLVVLSSNGAEKSEKLGAITPLSLLERELHDLPYASAFVRPGSFYENFLNGLQSARNGTFQTFYAETDRLYPMTAIADIAAEVASLLTGPPWTGRRIVEIGSMVSPQMIADALGQTLGMAVAARSIRRDKWPEALRAMGFSPDQTWAFEEIYDGANSGHIGFGSAGAERVEGRTSAAEVFAAASKA